jgi:glutamine synthetase
LGFDGSSIRGWQTINESDMLVVPEAETAFIDPFTAIPTIAIICNIQDPITREDYSRDPRNIAKKSIHYLQNTGVADTCFIGPEAEFFIFDDVHFDQTANAGHYFVDSIEGEWNRGKNTRAAGEGPNLGYKLRHKEGYFPVPPADQMMDIRNEMMQTMIQMGLDVECQHHEVGTAGQAEIDLHYDALVTMADKMMIYKYAVKNTAAKYGKSVTFMPKPIYGDNGSGMHTHVSLWKNQEPLFAGGSYAGLSEMALWAIGGLLQHAASVLAFTNPTTNSYKRLVPGYEAPVNLAYSQRNRSAACRIPMYSASPRSKRVEFRCPDPSCNPYLGFSAILMAMLDGIENKIDPGKPLDQDIYELSADGMGAAPTTPSSLYDALEALKSDRDFLLRGNVFTEDVIETWINYKMENEVDALRRRPHPFEFCMYYDI